MAKTCPFKGCFLLLPFFCNKKVSFSCGTITGIIIIWNTDPCTLSLKTPEIKIQIVLSRMM